MRKRTQTIEFDDLVDDIMRQWPETIRVFLDFRMSCVGCPIATFHTVEDSCREHGVDLATFLAALQESTRQSYGPRNVTEAGAVSLR